MDDRKIAHIPAKDIAPSFSLGLGLTNECNLACAFCYRDTERVDRLGPEQVRAALDALPMKQIMLR